MWMSAYAPRTSILGELSMNRTLIALLITMLAFGVYAQEEETPNYLCISDESVGLSWKNGQWVQGHYPGKKFLVKNEYVYRFGDTNPSMRCEEVTNDEFNCTGAFHWFKFSRKTLNFGFASMMSVLSPDDHSYKDTMYILHGKCSPL